MEFTKENVIKLLNDCVEFLGNEADKALTRIEDNKIIEDYLKGKHDSLKNVCMFFYDIISMINDMNTTEDLIDKENK